MYGEMEDAFASNNAKEVPKEIKDYICLGRRRDATEVLHTWKGKTMAIDDGDTHHLNYRGPTPSRTRSQKKYKDKFESILKPPVDTDEMEQIASFFQGWDWGRSGQAELRHDSRRWAERRRSTTST
jgi:hypothetical protein